MVSSCMVSTTNPLGQQVQKWNRAVKDGGQSRPDPAKRKTSHCPCSLNMRFMRSILDGALARWALYISMVPLT